jgi:hypothetical protein
MTLRSKTIRVAYSMPTGSVKTALLDLLAAKPGPPKARRYKNRDLEGGGWIVECPRHNTLVQVPNRTEARRTETVDFCEECYDLYADE